MEVLNRLETFALFVSAVTLSSCSFFYFSSQRAKNPSLREDPVQNRYEQAVSIGVVGLSAVRAVWCIVVIIRDLTGTLRHVEDEIADRASDRASDDPSARDAADQAGSRLSARASKQPLPRAAPAAAPPPPPPRRLASVAKSQGESALFEAQASGASEVANPVAGLPPAETEARESAEALARHHASVANPLLQEAGGPAAQGASRAGRALPPGWTENETAAGQVYYFNARTGETSWTFPTAPRRGIAAAAAPLGEQLPDHRHHASVANPLLQEAGGPAARERRALGEGWTEHETAAGQLYYFNARTGEMSWDDPGSAAPARP